MKKNDLIALLQSVEGNPDIMLWNGLVGDCADIDKSIHKDTLTRDTKKYIETWAKTPQYNLSDDEIKALMKKRKWEYRTYLPEEQPEWFEEKQVYILQAKVKGEKYWSHDGTISY